MKNVALAIAILVSTLFSIPTALASDTHIVLVSLIRQASEPVTYYITSVAEISTLDPQRASDITSINAVESLFLGLTDNDPTTPTNTLPELATDWTVSNDGMTWTFTIRNDVPWVRWLPNEDEAQIVRMVTAQDIAYGIQRACDPRLGAYYTSVADKIIQGCNDLSQKSPDEVTETDYSLVQVETPDDTTLIVHLQFPAGYFFGQTSMWMYRPVPREVIEEFGDNWTDVGTIVTNGPFVLGEWSRGVRRVFLRNPYLPEDMRGPGNIERVITTVVDNPNTTFALYQDQQVDISPIPAAELQSVLNETTYTEEIQQIFSMTVYYYAFAEDKPPFDNVHVRRAFAAMIDRNSFIEQTLQGRGLPMIHLIPPGTFGAAPINEAGIGYNADYARTEMESAGYSNCEGFPPVDIVTFQTLGTWGEFLAASAEKELGCDPSLFTIVSQEFSVLLETIDPRNTPQDRPELWTYAWVPDYPDANNWVGDVLHCEGENTFARPCSEVDDLVTQAAREADPNTRIEMYFRIEELFFGEDGEFPIAPLFIDADYVLFKPWVTGPFQTDGLFSGTHYNWITLDQEVQLAARNRD